MKKEVPILFSPPMVRAVFNGEKTETRRIVKPIKEGLYDGQWGHTTFTPHRHISFRGYHKNGQFGESFFKMKYCQGDILWVRENYLKPPPLTPKLLRDGADTWPKFDYPATLLDAEIDQYKQWGWKVKPSIHMPKEAARIWLEVTSVTVERLHDISEQSAINEGIYSQFQPLFQETRYKDYVINDWCRNPISSFGSLWVSINGKGSWDSNPWVWVVKFKVLKTK